MNPKAKIERYLISDLKLTGGLMLDVFDKITKYEDIMTEFAIWLDQRNYNFEQPISVENYTAKDIYDINPELDGIGAYNMLISLRDNPENAKKLIASGLKTE